MSDRNQIIKIRKNYSEEFKRAVCEEYILNGGSKSALLRKYGIQQLSAIHDWLERFGFEDIHVRYLDSSISVNLSPKKKPILSTWQTAEQRIKELERLLEDEQIKSEAYKRMIEIAEEELKVPIRKKPFTK